MIDYQQGKIYTIRCLNDNTLIYVGSTTQVLSQRLGSHKKKSRQTPERLIYRTINNNWDVWYIELYELYPCNSKMELEKREGEVIREIGTLNIRIAGRTKKEWYQDNFDVLQEQTKKYYQDNADKIKQYRQDNTDKCKESQKQYRQQNADKIKEKDEKYRQDNAVKIKQYRQEHSDKMKQYQKEYRERKRNKNNQHNITLTPLRYLCIRSSNLQTL